MPGSGELYRRNDGTWTFLVKSANGDEVAIDASDGFDTKEPARARLQHLLRGDFDGPIVDQPTLACGVELTEDTTLEDDLVCTGGPALILATDNITLDLNGHTVRGTQGAGTGAGIVLRNVQG